MILADTSVWVDHFRRGNAELERLLEAGEVLMHPLIAGELACGSLHRRAETLHALDCLPALPPATPEVVRSAIELHAWWGRGIGWVDAHLAASALIARVPLWTLDRRLASVVAKLGIERSGTVRR